MALKKDLVIEKRNILNEIRTHSMTTQELRFFSIYLAKINARDPSTRIVRFKFEEFRRIMEFGKLNNQQLGKSIDALLCKVVSVPMGLGGYERFQLFKECRVGQDEKNEWYIEIDAHDKALPLMFEFKKHYFTYELWNALRLKSPNQIRMYEILKQFEYKGERVITVKELRELLGIEKKEYPRFSSFRERVLVACQAALATYTDIKFTYEPKRGNHGKTEALKFIISHNENHVEQLSLDEFLNEKEMAGDTEDSVLEGESDEDFFKREIYPFMGDACNKEFKLLEIQVLYDMIVKIIPQRGAKNRQLEMYDYLKSKYDQLNLRASRTPPIKNRFAYIKKIIEIDLKEIED